jgi:hypothetical protein
VCFIRFFVQLTEGSTMPVEVIIGGIIGTENGASSLRLLAEWWRRGNYRTGSGLPQ